MNGEGKMVDLNLRMAYKYNVYVHYKFDIKDKGTSLALKLRKMIEATTDVWLIFVRNFMNPPPPTLS